jgi:hypothetical protein
MALHRPVELAAFIGTGATLFSFMSTIELLEAEVARDFLPLVVALTRRISCASAEHLGDAARCAKPWATSRQRYR